VGPLSSRRSERAIGAVSVVLALLFGLAQPARAETDTSALDAAIAQAKRDGKPLLIELTASWCGPCRYIEKHVLTQPQVALALQRFLFIRFDIDDERGEKIAEQLDAEGVPTFLALDAEGKVRARLAGIKDRPGLGWFLDFLRRAERATQTEEALARDLAAEPDDPPVLLDAARWYLARKRYEPALTYFDLAVSKDKDNRHGIASEAAWESAQLRSAIERRRRAVADAEAVVDAYPGSRAATAALLVAALSGDLSDERAAELCAKHAAALSDEAEPLLQATYIALAAGALDAALAAAKRLAEVPKPSFQGVHALAEVRLQRGELDHARIAAIRACASAKQVEERDACEALRRQVDSGKLDSYGAARMQHFADAYFDALERPERAAKASDKEWSFESSKVVAQWRRFRRAVDKGLKQAAKECLRDLTWRTPREVWVRLELGGADKPPRKVVILEPEASWRLGRCIRRVLSRNRLPATPTEYEDVYTGRVVFYPPRRRRRTLTPRDYSTPVLEHTYAFLRGGTGLADEVGFGVRSLLRFGKLADLHTLVHVDGHISKVSGADYSYDANLLVGVGINHTKLTVGLVAGIGASRVGDRLNAAYQVPLQLTLAVSGDTIRGLVWARSSYVLDDSERSTPSYALFGANETEFGLGARLPARSHSGVFLGLTYGQAVEDHRIAILLGTSIDSFAPR